MTATKIPTVGAEFAVVANNGATYIYPQSWEVVAVHYDDGAGEETIRIRATGRTAIALTEHLEHRKATSSACEMWAAFTPEEFCEHDVGPDWFDGLEIQMIDGAA
ncbi:MAG: hypothetical protein FWE08_03595 [Oscillospiraceae bacterium]|nr:hypothetical protein [Oscillospiraceae bacterium]